MEDILINIIHTYDSWIIHRKLSKHRSAQLLLTCIVDLINTYTEYMGYYPILFEKRMGNEIIDDFLLKNNINNNSDYRNLRKTVAEFSSTLPSLIISLEYENRFNQQKDENILVKWITSIIQKCIP
jgi:hypothetical protein